MRNLLLNDWPLHVKGETNMSQNKMAKEETALQLKKKSTKIYNTSNTGKSITLGIEIIRS